MEILVMIASSPSTMALISRFLNYSHIRGNGPRDGSVLNSRAPDSGMKYEF
jgi:hypothetical protein